MPINSNENINIFILNQVDWQDDYVAFFLMLKKFSGYLAIDRNHIFQMGRLCFNFRVYTKDEEKKMLTTMFQWIIFVQSFAVTTLCFLSIYYFSKISVSSFLSVDIVTLLIAVIFLSIIIIIVGYGSSASNTTFAWVFFHVFMTALLVIEVMVSLYTSDVASYLDIASEIWARSENDERLMLQEELCCCGLKNFTRPDNQNQCPKNAQSACLENLREFLETIRNVASVSMFVCFTIGLFIDFVGCAICHHPDIRTLADEEQEMDELEAKQREIQEFGNPFADM
ncbi:Tetraspanin family protein [Tritrichomonas foetus]|uniref:Tetraspanin family protein n=1 Tax=Tritrichomonas foetus TaxID=1144522 RepID=A0A1J4JTL1_9EUKA|nr:Tetraspanin family protein [Tritrichomonas foetus]|eukprot:OHT02455.1 Tetraspanin family protein [Tritrichomonas foetus]